MGGGGGPIFHLFTPLLPSPGWQKPIACIWENDFDGLYNGLHTRYSSVIVAMRNPLGKVSACEFSCW